MAQGATRIGTRIGLGFGAPMLLLVGVSVFAWEGSAAQLESSRWVAHTHRVMSQLEELLSLIKDVQSGGRGFAITGDERFLEPTIIARDALPGRIAALRTVMHDDPKQLSSLAALEQPLAGLMAHNDRLVAARRESGAAPAMAVVTGGEGARLVDDLRRRIGEMSAEERTLLAGRDVDMERTVRDHNRLLLLASVAALLIVAGVGLLLGRDITRVIAVQASLIDGVREAVLRLGTSTAELLAAATQQSSGAQEQAAAVTQTVTTVEEVTQTAEQAAQRARDVADSAQRSLEVSASGRRVVEESVSTIETLKREVETMAETVVGLAEQAQSIAEIVTSVDEIAEQSNLLALNAAIEASRAGDSGRGFAVVAGEVKALAGEARRATAKVREILGDIQRRTNTAVLVTERNTRSAGTALVLVSDAGERIKSLATTIADAAGAATQIAASASQQAVGMTHIQQAIRDVSQVTTHSLASTKQIERAGHDLDGLTRRLQALLAPHDVRFENAQRHG